MSDLVAAIEATLREHLVGVNADPFDMVLTKEEAAVVAARVAPLVAALFQQVGAWCPLGGGHADLLPEYDEDSEAWTDDDGTVHYGPCTGKHEFALYRVLRGESDDLAIEVKEDFEEWITVPVSDPLTKAVEAGVRALSAQIRSPDWRQQTARAVLEAAITSGTVVLADDLVSMRDAYVVSEGLVIETNEALRTVEEAYERVERERDEVRAALRDLTDAFAAVVRIPWNDPDWWDNVRKPALARARALLSHDKDE